MISNLRLPILVITQPVNGSEHIRPVGMASNTPPSAASDKCNDCCIAGIRDAQLAKLSPAIKNMAPTAIRSDKRDFISSLVISILWVNWHCGHQSSKIMQSMPLIPEKPLSAVSNGKFINLAEAAIRASGNFIELVFFNSIAKAVNIGE